MGEDSGERAGEHHRVGAGERRLLTGSELNAFERSAGERMQSQASNIQGARRNLCRLHPPLGQIDPGIDLAELDRAAECADLDHRVIFEVSRCQPLA
jgi:hypothetical protein